MKKVILLLAVLMICLAVSAQASGLLLLPSLKDIEEEAFMGDNSLENIEFPASLETIGARAFKDCVNTWSIRFDMAPNLREIGEEAFMGNTRLRYVSFGEGLEIIGPRAFKSCNLDYHVGFKANMREIGEEAFMGSPSLYSIYLNDGLETIGARAFYGWSGGVVEIPASLREIGEGAFHSDDGISLRFREGVETIDTLAFRDEKLYQVFIPESVTAIRENALPSSAKIICDDGSAAEAYGLANGNPMEVTPLREMISVAFYSYQRELRVQLSAVSGCSLLIEVLDDMTGNLLDTVVYPIEERLDNQQVNVNVETEAEYFILRVTLRDEHDSPVGDSVTRFDSVRPFDPEIEAGGSPSDYNGYIVSFGDSGFAALKEEVKVLEDGVELWNGNYSDGILVRSEQTFETGDYVYWPDESRVFRVRGVYIENGETVLDYTESDLALSDFYAYIRYKGTFDVPDTAADDGVSAGLNISRTFEYGDFSAQVSAGVSVTVDFRYNARPYATDFIDFASWVTMDANIALAYEKEYTFERELPLITYSVPTKIPGLLIDLDLTLPVSASAGAKAEVSAGFSGTLGFRYDSQHSNAIREMTPSWDLSVEGEITGEIGPRVSVGVSIMRIVSANVGARPGIRFEATSTIAEAHSNDEAEPDERHACGLCFDVLVKHFIDLDARLTALKKSLVSRSYNLYDTVIFDGYLSVLNDEHSVHGGHIVLGEGKCPNYEYRVDIDVIDPDAPGEIKQVRVYRIVDRVERALVAEGPAPLKIWLFAGDYFAESDHLGNPEGTPFTIVESPESMILDFMIVPIDEEHFPDENFRYLVANDLDLDKDLLLNSWERTRVKGLQFRNSLGKIDTFEGVEYFTELEELDNSYLNCYDADIDLSLNTKLRLVVTHARHLNVTGCTELRELSMPYSGYFGENDDGVYEIDLSTNTKLEYLRLDCNHLSQLDLSHNMNLISIQLYRYKADTLDLSGRTTLNYLIFGDYSPIYTQYNQNKVD